MAKQKNDYFSLIVEQLGFCVAASDLLERLFSHHGEETIQTCREQMHEIEHRADDIQHSILNRLSVEFITPIDQEDILHLVQIIDDITDALDEVAMELYMFGITKLPDAAGALSHQVNSCTKALLAAGEELKHFKKPSALRAHLIEVNTIEGEADLVYMKAIHDLFAGKIDCKTLIGFKEVYDRLESCCDLCEHAADVIAQIIVKNT